MMKVLYCIVLLGLATSSAWWIKKKYHYTTAKGCIKCQGQPMPFVKIQLKDKDLLFDDTMANGRARSDGCFTITGRGRDGFSGKPEPYIRAEYQYSGFYGKMEVEHLVFGKNRGGATKDRRYNRHINFGTINFNSIHCRSYVYFYHAMKNFRQRAFVNIPGGTLHIRTGVLLHGGSAYAMTNIIRIPNSYSSSRITTRLARHELAHIVRHRCDGSSAHFGWDAIRFWYMRSHSCYTKSNNGYAFNEGWAEYWAGSCFTGTYGSSLTDYRYEGNVAKALKRLKTICSSSDKRFTYILRKYPGKIHSFASFNNYHRMNYGCRI